MTVTRESFHLGYARSGYLSGYISIERFERLVECVLRGGYVSRNFEPRFDVCGCGHTLAEHDRGVLSGVELCVLCRCAHYDGPMVEKVPSRPPGAPRGMAQNPVACSRCYAPLLSEDEREAGIHARHEADRG